MADVYEIVVFGATSYTGKFICEDLANQCAEIANISWAVAGRNDVKMKTLLANIADESGYTFVKKIPRILVNIEDTNSLQEMAKRAKIVINCVGPYVVYGEEVIKACIANNTHHLDISGESYFLESMQLKYNDEAAKNGVFVIGALGFVSMFAEIGMKYTHNQFPMRLNDVEAFVEFKGVPPPLIHYGTYVSFVNSFPFNNKLSEIRQTLFPKPLPRPLHIQKSRGVLFYEPAVSSWCVPFIGSDRDTVFRSQVHLYESKVIPKAIQFRPYLCVSSFLVGWIILMCGFVLGLFTSFKWTRTFMLKYYKLFSIGLVSKEGSPAEVIHNSSFSTTFIGRGHKVPVKLVKGQTVAPTDTNIVTRLTGPNAGYVTTSKCIVQAAITILKERENMPLEGGVYAPAAAFWKTGLFKRLEEQGFILETIPDIQPEAAKKKN